MTSEVPRNTGCCDDSCNCGCRIDVFPVDEKCPLCGGRLRLIGRSQELQMRLSCPGCGYASALLSPQEIARLF